MDQSPERQAAASHLFSDHIYNSSATKEYILAASLKGRIGAHSVLHTHNRKLEYHPHVHMIVPAGVVDKTTGHWRYKAENYLFPALNLAKVFRAKVFDGIMALDLKANQTLPEEWVVHCKAHSSD